MLMKIQKMVSNIAILGLFRTGRAVANRVWQEGGFRMGRGAWAGRAEAQSILGDFKAFLALKKRRRLTFIEPLFATIPLACALEKAHLYKDMPLGSAYWMNDIQSAQWYRDIRVESAGMADIKDAWHRGRCHEVPLYAWAYCNTKDERFRDAALFMMADWISHNQYLYGVHWVGPMEVALRAVNWIVGIELLGDVFFTSANAEQIVYSLYDHMTYLEQRWELYDGRTNNHYLANLVGYLYLCWFFYDLPGMEKKWTWCIREIEREWDWQIFDEGTSYEGSTQYHALVMELLFFAKELARDQGTPFDSAYENKFGRMATFYVRCRIARAGQRVVIGDDGSDSLMPILSRDVIAGIANNISGVHENSITYPQFGLSIMQRAGFHVSLRHYAYTPRQPSGHFHNDRESITLAYNEIAIIVDPGSYVYTRSPQWRNYFRSVKVHNTFFIEGHEPADLNAGLFVLPRAHSDGDYIPHREISLEHGCVTISDYWEIKKNIPQTSCWNFTTAPGIEVQSTNRGWIFVRDGIPLVRMESDLIFERYDGWVSPMYGVKQKAYGLRARAPLSSEQRKIYFLPVEPSLL